MKNKQIKNDNKNKIKDIIVSVLSSILFFLLVLSIFKLAGSDGLSEHALRDSYTLQAMAWKDGRISLSEEYFWLELAVINDEYLEEYGRDNPKAYEKTFMPSETVVRHIDGSKYYVSFPPFPSVPMFVLSLFFGENTPNNLVTVIYCTIAFAFLLLICRRFRFSYFISICGASFVSIASSAFFFAANGGAGEVWFQAQSLALLLTAAAFFFILGKKDSDFYIAFVLLALAVGCRPFQIIYYIYFIYIVLVNYDFKVIKTIKFYIAPAIIGGIYMLYNYVRFGNIFEFGHNYLPEFMLSEEGQFSISYIVPNLKELLTNLPYITDMGLKFDLNGFAFWIANSLYVLMVIGIIYYLIRVALKSDKPKNKGIKNKHHPDIIILFTLIIVHILLIAAHKTLGLWQFGSRYTVDLLPAVLIVTAITLKPAFSKRKNTAIIIIRLIAVILLISGCFLNIVGCYKLFNLDVVFDNYTIINYLIILFGAVFLYILYDVFYNNKYLIKNRR